jgi:hypothetical protein
VGAGLVVVAVGYLVGDAVAVEIAGN